MNRMEELLSEALETQAERVRTSPDAWAENQRRVHRARRVRRSATVLGAAAAVTAVAVGFQVVDLPAVFTGAQQVEEAAPTPGPRYTPMPPPPGGVRLPDLPGGRQQYVYAKDGMMCVQESGGPDKPNIECSDPALRTGDAFGGAIGAPTDEPVKGSHEWLGTVSKRAVTLTVQYSDGTAAEAPVLSVPGLQARVYRVVVTPSRWIVALDAKDTAGRTIATHGGFAR